MNYPADKIAFVDIETTGLHPTKCAIWEIAIILGDDTEYLWHVDGALSALRIDRWVLENTRFEEDYKKDTVEVLSRPETANKLEELLNDRHIVGACPWFDSQRLHQLWMDFGTSVTAGDGSLHPWHYHLIDIESIALGIRTTTGQGLPELPWKSNDIMDSVGLPVQEKGKHEALEDCRWAKQVFEACFGEAEV